MNFNMMAANNAAGEGGGGGMGDLSYKNTPSNAGKKAVHVKVRSMTVGRNVSRDASISVLLIC